MSACTSALCLGSPQRSVEDPAASPAHDRVRKPVLPCLGHVGLRTLPAPQGLGASAATHQHQQLEKPSEAVVALEGFLSCPQSGHSPPSCLCPSVRGFLPGSQTHGKFRPLGEKEEARAGLTRDAGCFHRVVRGQGGTCVDKALS